MEITNTCWMKLSKRTNFIANIIKAYKKNPFNYNWKTVAFFARFLAPNGSKIYARFYL